MEIVDPIRSTDDIKNMRKAFKRLRDLILFDLGITSALRVSDLLNLNVEDVYNRTEVKVREQKTGKYKKFPLQPQVQQEIAQYLATRGEFDMEEPLFLSQKGYRIDRQQAHHILKQAAKKAGVKGNIGTHSLRKTFGYHHYKKFNDIGLLQKILNHSSSAITLMYIGITQEIIDMSYKNFNLLEVA